MREVKQLSWEVGHAADAAGAPERWVPAEVPGAVQLDWARAIGMEHCHFGDNHMQYRWMEDRWWTYRTRLDLPRPGRGHRAFFVCKGIDYRFAVRAGGTELLRQEGMYTPVEVDITEQCGSGAELFVALDPIPKSIPDDQCSHRLKWQADQSVKPAVSYEWDFHPRLVPLGIWDEAYVEVRPACHLKRSEARYELSDDLRAAAITFETACSMAQRGMRVRWRLIGQDGKTVVEESADLGRPDITGACRLENPALWWPNEQGEPYLYTFETEIVGAGGEVADRLTSRVGFRRVRLVMHPDAWKEPSRYPKTRSTPPITLEINGRRVFGKGSNWVSPEIFPGLLNAATYRTQLALARDAHFNLLRCWGGANVQKDTFFDICDEMGLMVWQEFTLACNNYAGTPAYLAVLDRESRSIVTRLRPHPSVVLWCGGNELLNSWSGMTDQSAALRLLNRNTFDLDPGRPFLTSSPVMGMAHGPYWFVSKEEGDVFHLYRECAFNAYTEFGCDSPAHADTIRRLLPADDMYPLPQGGTYRTQRARQGLPPEGRMKISGVTEYFDAPATLEEYVEKGQMLQGIGLKCAFEEMRRQKPRCSMAVSWCFNEPWPALANQSIVAWPSRPKPAYGDVQAALRPVLASARIPSFVWTAGELFEAELWLLSDSPAAVAAGRMTAELRVGDTCAALGTWPFEETPPNSNRRGPTLRARLPLVEAPMFELAVRVEGRADCDSTYRLRLVQPAAPARALAPRTSS